MAGLKACGQFYLWYSYLLQANSVIAVIANKMYMVIVMVPCLTIVFTKGVQNRVIGGGYQVDDSFFYKGL
jgi:hypothetical protein